MALRIRPSTLASLATLLPGLALLAGCGSTARSRLPGPPETFSHRVERDDLPTAGRLVLDAGDCHIRVVHGVARAVRFEARLHALPRAEAETRLRDLQIGLRTEPGLPATHHLSVTCPDPDHGPADSGQWTLVLPDGDAATLRTRGGTVDVQALDCDLAIETGSGPVRADLVAGEVSIRSGSGRVRVTGPFGHARIHTDSGPVDVTVPDPDLSAAGLRVQTGSGRVALHAAAEDLDELRFVTDRGSIEGNLTPPSRLDPETGSTPERPARLYIETRSGDLYLWRLVESRAASMARARRVGR